MKYRKKFVPVRRKLSGCIGTQPAPLDSNQFFQYHLRVLDADNLITMRIDRQAVTVGDGYDSISEMLDAVIHDTTDKVRNRTELNVLLNKIAVSSRRGRGNLVTIDGVNYVIYVGRNVFDAPFIRHYCDGKAKYIPHPDIKSRCIRIPKIRFVIR